MVPKTCGPRSSGLYKCVFLFQGIVGCTPIYKPYISPISTMGTLLGVQPIVP